MDYYTCRSSPMEMNPIQIHFIVQKERKVICAPLATFFPHFLKIDAILYGKKYDSN